MISWIVSSPLIVEKSSARIFSPRSVVASSSSSSFRILAWSSSSKVIAFMWASCRRDGDAIPIPAGRLPRRRQGDQAVASGPLAVSLRGGAPASERAGDAAVLPDSPEMDGQEDRRQQRQEHDVEHVEPQQG